LALNDLGVRLIQAYVLAKPAFESLVPSSLIEQTLSAAAA